MALRLLYLLVLLASSACYKTVVLQAPVSKSDAIYQVKAGDTLYSVSKRHGTNYRTLARRNHLHSPYTIYTGQRLYLRGVAPRPSYIPLPKRHRKPTRGRGMNRKKRPGHGMVKLRSHKSVSTVSHRRVVHLSWPVRGKVTSKFGRRHGRPHDGIDISVPEGTPVRAAAEGDVVYSSRRLTGYGNLIIIRHTHDMFTAYAHNQSNLVRRGTHVKRGEIIARAGRTGHASGPHVHFEVRRGPTPVNPLVYLPKRQRKRR